jgi:hypothetical protein
MTKSDYKDRLPFWNNEAWSLDEFLTARSERYKDISNILVHETNEIQSRRPKYEQETMDKLISLEKLNELILDPNGAFMKYLTEEDKEKKYEDTYGRLNDVDGGVLIWWINNLLIEKELAYQTIDLMAKELTIVTPKYVSEIIEHHKTTRNRQQGRSNTFKSNNECLEKCYKEFSRNLARPVLDADYPAYKRYLIKCYPTPPFTPKPKLTKDEKQGTKEMQDADRASKERGNGNKWVDSTVRDAFYKLSGIKPTTLKK